MFGGVGKVAMVIFSSYRVGTWRAHAFKGQSLALLENELFSPIAEGNSNSIAVQMQQRGFLQQIFLCGCWQRC